MTIQHPTAVVCPVCNAQVHEPCTQPIHNTRREVKWHHMARIESVSHEPSREELTHDA